MNSDYNNERLLDSYYMLGTWPTMILTFSPIKKHMTDSNILVYSLRTQGLERLDNLSKISQLIDDSNLIQTCC